MHKTIHLLGATFLAIAMSGCVHDPSNAGWQPIFDGKTLADWSAPDMSYWRVEDEAITGETTRDHNPPRNQFIVWQGGDVADFEFKFEVRIFGAQSNSGMQFRSSVKDHGLVHGYQADLDGAGKYFAGIWDEYGPRQSLAARGQSVVIAADGTKTTRALAGVDAAMRGIELSQWTEYYLKAVGPRIQLWINGVLTTELEDHETGKAAASGVIAMPIIPGEPMKVQFRRLQLKRL